MTRLTPDGEGGFFVEREPEFSRGDIDLLEAARRAEESISPRGFTLEEEFDPANKFRFQGAEPRRNYAVAAQAEAERDFRAKYPDEANFDGFVFPIELLD